MISEAADLIYHVVLVLRPLNISFESITDIFKQQIDTSAQVSSLGAAANLAVRCYNRMVIRRNNRLLSNCRVESVIAKILEKLSCEVFTLCFLSIRIGLSTYVSALRIKDAIYNVLFSVLLILHYRDISYQNVVDELYSRVSARAAKPKADVKG